MFKVIKVGDIMSTNRYFKIMPVVKQMLFKIICFYSGFGGYFV